VYLKNV